MITIRGVSRLTGLAAATLRAWEQRFGFPVSVLIASGQRQYYERDMDDLMEIVRRQSLGEPIAKVMEAVRPAQQNTRAQTHSALGIERDSDVALALRYLMEGDLNALETWVETRLRELGVGKFSHDIIHPLMEAVGELWKEGILPIYAENAFTSVLQRSMFGMSQPIAGPSRNPFLVLFASPPGEKHSLGLTFGNAMFNTDRIASVMLTGGLSVSEIARAATVYKARVVALSASLSYSTKLLIKELVSLRKLLPQTVDIWLGGAGSYPLMGGIPGVDVLDNWDEALQRHKRYSNPPAPARGRK